MTASKKAKRWRTAHRESDAGTASALHNTFATPGASRYLGVSAATLRFWRANGEGPRYFHAGERLVRYRRIDLDTWVESRLSK
jgi:predicted DNA-binding transcriptional regulator AlpA